MLPIPEHGLEQINSFPNPSRTQHIPQGNTDTPAITKRGITLLFALGQVAANSHYQAQSAPLGIATLSASSSALALRNVDCLVPDHGLNFDVYAFRPGI